jgi:hypothetical protein
MIIYAAKPHLFSIARRAADPPEVSHCGTFDGKPIVERDWLKRYIVETDKPALAAASAACILGI